MVTNTPDRKPLGYWTRVINDAISELARSETRDRSTMPLRVTLAAIAHHIESGAVMPPPNANSQRWQTEWPGSVANDRQWWWLYARCWGDAEPKLYPVQVWRLANSTAWVATGHFIYPHDIEGPALWLRATLPELPSEGVSE
jgi:hypothetical protein